MSNIKDIFVNILFIIGVIFVGIYAPLWVTIPLIIMAVINTFFLYKIIQLRKIITVYKIARRT